MAEAVRAVMTAESPAAGVAAVADGPDDYDAKLWKVLSSDLGVTGLLVPGAGSAVSAWAWREVRTVRWPSWAAAWPASRPVQLRHRAHGPTRRRQRGGGGAAPADRRWERDRRRAAPSVEALLGPVPVAAGRCQPGRGRQLAAVRRAIVRRRRRDGHCILVPAAVLAAAFAGSPFTPAPRAMATAAMSVVDTTRPQATVRLDQARARLVGGFSGCDAAVGPVGRGRDRPRLRAVGREPVPARAHGRLLQDQVPVRVADRLVPGGPAPASRPGHQR